MERKMGATIGIDFGTTNTVLTYKNKAGRYRQLTVNGYPLIPSALLFLNAQEYEYGTKAINMGDAGVGTVISGFKMLLGEKQCKIPIKAGDKEFNLRPSLAVKYFLNKIVGMAETRLIKEFGSENGLIDKAVITVPVKFTPVEKEAIRKAAVEAIGRGKKTMVRLAYEPTAAAIGALENLSLESGEPLLVYDFGGGTFDISIIKYEHGAYRQLYSDGDPNLGGNDLTRKVADYLLNKLNEDFGTNLPLDEGEFDADYHEMPKDKYDSNIKGIFKAANLIKETLSTNSECGADINFYYSASESDYCGYSLSKTSLEVLLHKAIEKTVDITCRAMTAYSEIYQEPVRHLVLAGGSSQIPLVRELLEQRLPDITIHGDGNSSTLISLGAAILADRIEELDSRTSQITTTRIGVRAADGVQYNKFHTIIPENQPLPCEGSKDFYLSKDGQTVLKISYYEHDVQTSPNASTIVEEGMREVDTLTVDLPPGLLKDETVVRVSFRIASDGSMELGAVVKDLAGNVAGSGNLDITKDSDLE